MTKRGAIIKVIIDLDDTYASYIILMISNALEVMHNAPFIRPTCVKTHLQFLRDMPLNNTQNDVTYYGKQSKQIYQPSNRRRKHTLAAYRINARKWNRQTDRHQTIVRHQTFTVCRYELGSVVTDLPICKLCKLRIHCP